MDIKTAHILTDATKNFYAHEAQSFSDTRTHPWLGWPAVIDLLRQRITKRPTSSEKTIRVLDIGAGNLRFEHYLQNEFDGFDIKVLAIDSCPDLVNGNTHDFEVEFIELDVIATLENNALSAAIPHDQFDIAVAFGLMHHIPLPEWRIGLLNALRSSLDKEGLGAVSFWQFMRSERLANLATTTTDKAFVDLGITLDTSAGDYMLGWQNKPGIYRYCHHFTDDEINRLIIQSDIANNTMSDFCSERGFLNRYVIFERNVD